MIGDRELLAAMLDAESSGEEFVSANPMETAMGGAEMLRRSGIDPQAAFAFARGRARAVARSFEAEPVDIELALMVAAMQALVVGVRVGSLVDADR